MDPNYIEKLQHFSKYQFLMFKVLGVYHLPNETSKLKKNAYEKYFAMVFFWAGTYNLCLLIEFFVQPTMLDKIVNVFFGLATFIGSTTKLVYVKVNGSIYQEMVGLLVKEIFTPTNPDEDDILDRNIKLTKRVRNFYGWVSFLALIYVLILHKIAHPEDLPVAAYNPFEIDFKIMEIYSFLMISVMCFINIAYDSWCTSFLIFATAQLEFLAYRLERIGKDNTNSLAINATLKKCINHHSEVLDFVKIIERTMTIPVSIQIFCSISVLCCNFYAMSFTSIKEDISSFLTFFMYQMAMLSQIFLLSYFSNEVTLASLKLPYALYSSNWITWDRANRKLMLLIMLRFQEPIIVRSINRCYPFNLATFTSIVNTSYSYYALLKQMNN